MTAPKDMFLPGSRNEWTSIVRPPEGYRIDGAIGTTYGLDFTALTAILLASLDQVTDRARWEDHAHLLQAITRLEERVRVVVHRGQIHADIRPSNKIFALFDRMVCEAKSTKGNFHPKVWIVKYSPCRPIDTEERRNKKTGRTTRDAIYRLLCTSRNLTLASTWEAVVCLDGCLAEGGEGASTAIGRDVAGFFDKVLATGDQVPITLKVIVNELRRVAFSTDRSKAVQSCEFRWQWPGMAGLMEAVAPGGKTGLIVAPFIRFSFLKALARKFDKLIVVSGQEELDNLWGERVEALIPLENFWVVKDSDGDEAAENTSSLDLHAKLLLCEYAKHGTTPAHTEAWLGSANGSDSAWGSSPTGGPMNCEAMVRIRPSIRPDQFMDQFAYRGDSGRGKNLEPILNGWIEHYQPLIVEEPDDEASADKLLECVKKEVAMRTFRASFARTGDQVMLTVKSPDLREWAALFAQYLGIQFEMCPLGLADGGAFRDLQGLLTVGIQFDGMSIAQAGAFLLVQLTHVQTGRRSQFVVKAVTEMDEGFWDERRVAFLKENVTAERFRELLRFILFEGVMDTDEPNPGGNGRAANRPPKKSRQGILDDFAVEDILQACTQDRSRVEEIDRLLKTFEGTKHVDDAFREFWANFHEAIRAAEDEVNR